MKLLDTKLTITILSLIFCSLSVNGQVVKVIETDKITREEAHKLSLKKAKQTQGSDSRFMGASYSAGFDAALFESKLESNGCLETQQINVTVVDVVNQVGTYSNGVAGAGLAIDEGIILSTGTIEESFTDNNAVLVSLGTSDANAIADPDFDALDPGGQTTHNESILIIDFTIPENLNGLRVPFQFSSDEYPEYVGTQFNDVFGFFISGPGITGTQNIALVPGTDNVIAVNSINNGTVGDEFNVANYPATGPVFYDFAEYFIDNTDGTNAGPIEAEYDGFTTILFAEIEGLIPGETYQLKLGVADTADHYGDSAVFIGPLEGISSEYTVKNCACDYDDPDTDCDGDGYNNGDDCNPYDETIAISGDACTDSNSEAGIIDEFCNCIATGGGTSGGNEGGLESNNRLAEKIAKRNLQRTINPKEEDVLKSNGDIPFDKENFDINKSAVFELSQVIPTDIWGAYVAESSPTDLLEITNAVEVIAADYYLGGVRNAVVLAIESENGVYEHSKYICDRLDGASLLDVTYLNTSFGQFISYKIETKTGLIEYATSFSGYIEGDNFEVENHWNLSKYSVKEQYYNFQIWTSSIEKTKSLLMSILNNIDNQIKLGETLTGTIPNSFVKNGYYDNGQLHLNILNKGNVESLAFKGQYRTTETSSEELFETNVSTNQSLLETIVLEPGYLYDMGLSMIIDEDHSDELFIADGTWGYDDMNQNSNVKEFEIIEQIDLFDDNVKGIERGFEIKTSVKDYQNIFRSMTPKWESVDLSIYDAMSFRAKGACTIQITLANPTIQDWSKQVSYTISLTEESQDYVIDFEDFVNFSQSADLSQINLIMITIVGDNIDFQDKVLSMNNIQFGNLSGLTSSEEITLDNKTRIFPNPTINQINISCAKTLEYDFRIYDTRGTLMMSAININAENHVVDLSILESGVYYFELNYSNGEKEIQKIVKI